MDEQGVFQAGRIELKQPRQESALIGTVEASKGEEFLLLGQQVQIYRETDLDDLERSALGNTRVKVVGDYRGPDRFSARRIKARKPGKDRIDGVISEIKKKEGEYLVTILGREIRVPEGVEFVHKKPLLEYRVANVTELPPGTRQLSEDKQFGTGVRLSENIRFTALTDFRGTRRENYNLNDNKSRDREDLGLSIRGRLIFEPSDSGVAGQLEVRQTRLERDEDRKGKSSTNDTRLSESFIFFGDLSGGVLDLQAGRINFDDRREWLYDQNLDGLRAFWRAYGYMAELSVTTTLSDGNERDEDTYNYIAYLTDEERRLAGYVIHRDTSHSDTDQDISHIGVRAYGKWPTRHKSWLEASVIYGTKNDTDLRGWGFDLGTIRSLGRRGYLTAAWAFGKGDGDPKNGTDGNFRQTGLQDNNGKFGGVTSFKYYGELFDPELANLHILTLGVGSRLAPRFSIDLVGHYYRQDEADNKIVKTDLDRDPTGDDRALGWEVDAIIGWRPVPSWDFEIVVARFDPGSAFSKNDEAWLGKLHVRYRY